MKISSNHYEIIKKYFNFIKTSVDNDVIPNYPEKHNALNELGNIYKTLWDSSYTLKSCSSCVYKMLRWCYGEYWEYQKLIDLQRSVETKEQVDTTQANIEIKKVKKKRK